MGGQRQSIFLEKKVVENIKFNIKAAWAVDREFVYIVGPVVLPLVAFGLTLDSFWSFGVPFGSLWGALGLPLAHFGCPWPPLGRHLGPISVPLAFLGLPGRSGLNLGSIFRANVAQVPRLRTKSSFLELASGCRGCRGASRSGVSKCSSGPPFHVRRGSG